MREMQQDSTHMVIVVDEYAETRRAWRAWRTWSK
jgi:hypothetical protein